MCAFRTLFFTKLKTPTKPPKQTTKNQQTTKIPKYKQGIWGGGGGGGGVTANDELT